MPLSAVDLSSRGRGLGADFMVLVPPAGEVGQERGRRKPGTISPRPLLPVSALFARFRYTNDRDKFAEGRIVASFLAFQGVGCECGLGLSLGQHYRAVLAGVTNCFAVRYPDYEGYYAQFYGKITMRAF